MNTLVTYIDGELTGLIFKDGTVDLSFIYDHIDDYSLVEINIIKKDVYRISAFASKANCEEYIYTGFINRDQWSSIHSIWS